MRNWYFQKQNAFYFFFSFKNSLIQLGDKMSICPFGNWLTLSINIRQSLRQGFFLALWNFLLKFWTGNYVRDFFLPSVGPSIRPLVSQPESKVEKTSIVDACVRGLGRGWGLDAPAHPSVTILWSRVTMQNFYKNGQAVSELRLFEVDCEIKGCSWQTNWQSCCSSKLKSG